MKTIGILGLIVSLGIVSGQPAAARPRGGHSSFSAPHHFSTSGSNFGSRSRSYSNAGARSYQPARRTSVRTTSPGRPYSGSGQRVAINRATALNPGSYSASKPQTGLDGRTASRNRNLNHGAQVPSRYTRNWDRRRAHYWRGHRCHWVNNSWIIFGAGLYPWIYGYPYGYYSYYDVPYDAYDAPTAYVYEPNAVPYETGGDSTVSDVQSALADAGYYHGAIDGQIGPATRSALRRYQRDNGLAVTGRIDGAVIESLGLRSQ